jgi:uncharacterized protein (TIGR03118 family)
MATFLGKWLRALTRTARPGARPHRGATHPQRIVPRLEVLEDRTVPSTLTVTNNSDTGVPGDGSLRGEIAAAQGGDTIQFAYTLLRQTITLTNGELAISKSLNIEGFGAPWLTVSGNNASRVFDVSGSTTNVTISGLTIADGLATATTAVGPFGPVTLGGGILNQGAHVTLSNVVMADNQAVGTQNGYVQTNLVSDGTVPAQLTDPNLQNPWGISESPTGPFSVADQKTSVDTSYSVTAAGVSVASAPVTIPKTAAGPQGPTGQVYNNTSSFLVNGTPGTYIFADLNGTISAWNGSAGTTAQVEATTTGAAYTGLDIESTPSGDFLYAANPKQGRIDVFNSSFALTSLGPNAFKDPLLPAGLVPFNVEGVNGDLYVSYGAAGAPAARNLAPEGSGAIAVFDTSGNFINQLTAGGKLASPWGMILAPSTFGEFGGALLVGNFSYADPKIIAFDPVSGAYLGTLIDASGNTLLGDAQGIWDMTFGNGGNGGLPGTLYFATGLTQELDGLFGAIDPLPRIASGGAVANIAGGTLEVSHSTFQDNRATGSVRGSGGAIMNDASTLGLDHSLFTGNEAVTLLGSAPGIQGNALSGAVYNAGGSQATVSYTTFANNSAHGGNGADGTATAPNGGNAGTGVGGAFGNEAISLLGPFAPSTATVADCLFLDNQAIGGTGGTGWAGGGNGGNGSSGGLSVAGGAINNGSSTLTVISSMFIGNEAIGGNGGAGAGTGSGGAGSNGAGGAISSVPTPSFVTGATPVSATLHVSGSMFLDNKAIGGAGGAGGGNGGVGGAGQGGALRASLTAWDVRGSMFLGNQAIGGAGGAGGGSGGAGQGGALLNVNGSVGTVSASLLMLNEAVGGAGGLGGNGGNGQGGGAFNGGPVSGATASITFLASGIVFNEAEGGAAGSGGSAGGLGQGGGLYLTSGGDALADALTVIFANHASTSDDDVFGTLGRI